MKRPLSGDGEPDTGEFETDNGDDKKMKKVKLEEDTEEHENQVPEKSDRFGDFDENLLFEVLKHVDAKTLTIMERVCKQWRKTAQDERLWASLCSKLWADGGGSEQQLHSVAPAVGGFRRLHPLLVWLRLRLMNFQNGAHIPAF